MRRDEQYLRDILQAGEEAGQFLAGVDSVSFLKDRLRRRAVLQLLTEVGEAASRLSEEARALSPTTAWSDIVAFRNIAVHAYFAVNWTTVWETAVADLPLLCRQVEEVLKKLDARS